MDNQSAAAWFLAGWDACVSFDVKAADMGVAVAVGEGEEGSSARVKGDERVSGDLHEMNDVHMCSLERSLRPSRTSLQNNHTPRRPSIQMVLVQRSPEKVQTI